MPTVSYVPARILGCEKTHYAPFLGKGKLGPSLCGIVKRGASMSRVPTAVNCLQCKKVWNSRHYPAWARGK